MSIQEDVRNSLTKEFSNRKKRNPRYSLRAFALSLGISVSRLSDILNDKRKLSKLQLEKINDVLGGSWSLQLLNINDYNQKNTFTDDQFQSISHWIYISVLTFLKANLKAKKQEYTTAELSEVFEMRTNEMTQILNRLLRLELVKKTSTGWIWTSGPEKTTDQVPSKAVRQFHKSILAEGISKLEITPVEERDYSSLIITIDPNKLPEAKEEIKKFRRRMATYLEDGTQDQVFALNIQLFPLTTKRNSKDLK